MKCFCLLKKLITVSYLNLLQLSVNNKLVIVRVVSFKCAVARRSEVVTKMRRLIFSCYL